ncbi:hypothetical protein ILYODFUR_020375 [Ilyodon furcidens]|uniref:Uncharacterized protein n=1 Tax=Ilyodon furcidens TaxID=33524 RepID=A0ABV0V5N4_9TELE
MEKRVGGLKTKHLRFYKFTSVLLYEMQLLTLSSFCNTVCPDKINSFPPGNNHSDTNEHSASRCPKTFCSLPADLLIFPPSPTLSHSYFSTSWAGVYAPIRPSNKLPLVPSPLLLSLCHMQASIRVCVPSLL